jgi:hypothetical protein
VKLEDPTSVTLMNSFLIKNIGNSFDHINIKRPRKANTKPNNDASASQAYQGSATLNSSANPFGASYASPNLERGKNTYGKVQEKRPPARDGHTGIIVEGTFYVFGGDRHHMPFNDLYMLDIKQEFKDRQINSE